MSDDVISCNFSRSEAEKSIIYCGRWSHFCLLVWERTWHRLRCRPFQTDDATAVLTVLYLVPRYIHISMLALIYICVGTTEMTWRCMVRVLSRRDRQFECLLLRANCLSLLWEFWVEFYNTCIVSNWIGLRLHGIVYYPPMHYDVLLYYNVYCTAI